jgi:hypothetical protein
VLVVIENQIAQISSLTIRLPWLAPMRTNWWI